MSVFLGFGVDKSALQNGLFSIFFMSSKVRITSVRDFLHFSRNSTFILCREACAQDYLEKSPQSICVPHWDVYSGQNADLISLCVHEEL